MISKAALLAMENDRLRRLATYASIAVAFILIIAKLVAYFMTDSVAMMSSLLDSTIDLLASIVTAFGVASAMQPPDSEHRYGHGKAEPLAALTQAAFIIGSSILLAYEALSRFYHAHDIQNEAIGYGVMGLAIILTLFLLALQRFVVRRTSSMAIGADHVHYWGDLLVNIAVVVAFGLHQLTGLEWFDPVFALAIAVGFSYSAYKIAGGALNVLMDRELPDRDREKIKTIVRGHKKVRGLHDLRTRTDGERQFIEFHLELDGNMTLKAAHEIDDALLAALSKDFPNADVLIHQDPAGIEEERLDTKIAQNAG